MVKFIAVSLKPNLMLIMGRSGTGDVIKNASKFRLGQQHICKMQQNNDN